MEIRSLACFPFPRDIHLINKMNRSRVRYYKSFLPPIKQILQFEEYFIILRFLLMTFKAIFISSKQSKSNSKIGHKTLYLYIFIYLCKDETIVSVELLQEYEAKKNFPIHLLFVILK
jgi:hypothetical protein